MSKTIKVSDETHTKLEDIRLKSETLGGCVARLLAAYIEVGRAMSQAAPSRRKGFLDTHDPIREAMLERRDLDARTIPQPPEQQETQAPQ